MTTLHLTFTVGAGIALSALLAVLAWDAIRPVLEDEPDFEERPGSDEQWMDWRDELARKRGIS